MRDVQTQVTELLAQGLSSDAQETGGLVLILPRILQNERQQEAVHLPMRVRGGSKANATAQL